MTLDNLIGKGLHKESATKEELQALITTVIELKSYFESWIETEHPELSGPSKP
jgi:hypothetical protein